VAPEVELVAQPLGRELPGQPLGGLQREDDAHRQVGAGAWRADEHRLGGGRNKGNREGKQLKINPFVTYIGYVLCTYNVKHK